jgi:hypothetical protein
MNGAADPGQRRTSPNAAGPSGREARIAKDAGKFNAALSGLFSADFHSCLAGHAANGTLFWLELR